jgi:acetylornithine deacetylase/succinyl-diaminopimelate desuccinylase-like protein
VRGSNAHSSLAPLYVNAVEFGALLVAFIRGQAERLMSDGARDPLYDITHSTAHVGVFKGGTALNIVPATAEIVYEYRVIAQDDGDALVAEAIDHARTVLEPRMRAVDPAAGIDFEVYTSFAGLDTQPEAPVVSLAKKLAGRNGHGKVAFGTEAGLFTAMAGIPAVVLGPGSIEPAHKADEFIELSELVRCGVLDLGNGLHVLGDEVADVDIARNVELGENVVIAGRGVDLRGDFTVGESGGDLVGLAKLAFDLDEKGLHGTLLVRRYRINDPCA